MKLAQVKGNYDVIAGLGSWCGPALHLKRHGLRKESYPLDWVQCPFLTELTKLLQNRFQDYMISENLIEITHIVAHMVEDGEAVFEEGSKEPVKAHYLHDQNYRIDSVHDFPMVKDELGQIRDWKEQYPAFRKKLDRRIHRFLTRITNGENVLFIRYEWQIGEYQDFMALHDTLMELTGGNFTLLILQQVEGTAAVIDQNWPHPNICFLHIPMYQADDQAIWDEILDGITITQR